ncbi:MAG: hypothetical protein HY054_06005 [Proteobacteria bacterium]|nr:hypothetical protein [Pseudomonadota bacterium]
MALLLIGTGVARAERQRSAQSGAPGVLTSAIIWLGVIAFVVLIYQSLTFWTNLGALFR